MEGYGHLNELGFVQREPVSNSDGLTDAIQQPLRGEIRRRTRSERLTPPRGIGLGTQGKSYLPGAGKSWAHLHRAPHSGPTGFRVGDHVRMRQGVAEFWELDARALVTAVTPADKEVRPPPHARRLRRNKRFADFAVYRCSSGCTSIALRGGLMTWWA
jgi:hypothetical protein